MTSQANNDQALTQLMPLELTIVGRNYHPISRKNISDNALKVLNRLTGAGFQAYLVGGAVRDLLLTETPKDFDIATNATPEQIKHLFRNCRLIGRRFRLAHIIFGRDIIEVATFRGHHQEPSKNVSMQSEQGMLLRDNVYGTINEDAARRDFSINAMYYNIENFCIYDFAQGRDDLNERLIRLIGDPETRYREDPVRMLRAIRFATKLDFDIEEDTAAPIEVLGHLLSDIPSARLYEESLKMLQSGYGLECYYLMREYKLFDVLFPAVAREFTHDYSSNTEQLLDLVFDSTDRRIEEGKRINPAFMFAAMLWYPLQNIAKNLMKSAKLNYYDAVMEASNIIIDEQIQTIAIPRRHTTTMREIWQLQLRLPKRNGNKAARLLTLNKFRAGFDFLEMLGCVEGGELKALAHWWHDYQIASKEKQSAMVSQLNSSNEGGRKSSNASRHSKRKPKKSS